MVEREVEVVGKLEVEDPKPIEEALTCKNLVLGCNRAKDESEDVRRIQAGTDLCSMMKKKGEMGGKWGQCVVRGVERA